MKLDPVSRFGSFWWRDLVIGGDRRPRRLSRRGRRNGAPRRLLFLPPFFRGVGGGTEHLEDYSSCRHFLPLSSAMAARETRLNGRSLISGDD
jgi:hypothetical protein